MGGSNSPLLSTIRRHWILLLVCGLLGTAAGAAWIVTQPMLKMTSGSVQLYPVPTLDNSGLDIVKGRAIDFAMANEAELLLSDEILDATVAEVGSGLTASKIRQITTVTPVPSATVLVIEVTNDNPELARALIDSLIKNGLAIRGKNGEQYVPEKLKSASQDVESADRALKAAEAELAQKLAEKGENATQIEDLEDKLAKAESKAQSVETKLANLEAIQKSYAEMTEQEMIDSSGRVLNKPGEPVDAPNPLRWVIPPVLAIVGLLLGLGLALLQSVTDRRIRSAQDLPNELVLAEVPGGTNVREPVTALAVGTSVEEAYRRARIMTLAAMPKPAVITLTSLGSPVAAAAAAANLAISAVQTGATVCVVDAVPECGRAGAWNLLGTNPTDGLAEAIAEGLPVEPLLQPSPWGPLVIGPGSPQRAMQVTGNISDHPNRIMDQLKQMFDYVFVVAPGPNTNRGESMAEVSDASVLVVTTGVTPPQAVNEARLQLEAVRTNVLGVLMLDQDRTEPANLTDAAAAAHKSASVLPR